MKLLFVNNFYGSNRGTVALALTAKSVISKSFPSAEFSIYLPWDDEYTKWYDGIDIVRAPFYRSRPKIIATAVRATAWYFFARVLRLNVRRLIDGEEYQSIRNCDVVIDLGGDTVTEDYGLQNLLLHFLPLLLAVIFDKPVVAYSHTMGPFRRWKYLATLLFKVFDLVIVRDKASRDTLRSVRYKGYFECTADTAFCLDGCFGIEKLYTIAVGEKRDLTTPYIAVNVSPMMDLHHRRRNPKSAELSYYRTMAIVIDKIVSTTGYKVILVPHVTGGSERNDDRFSEKCVAGYCRHSDRVQCVMGEYSPEEVKCIIANAEAMIGARMHSNIAALSSMVPTIAIAYSRKSSGIMEVCGCQEWVCPIEKLDVDTLMEKFVQLWLKREEIRATLRRRIPEVKKLAASNGMIFAKWYESYLKRRPR